MRTRTRIGAHDVMKSSYGSSITSRRGLGKALAAAIVAAACMLALTVDVAVTQDDLVRVDGRVLWIAAATMIVVPWVSGATPVNVDLSRVRQDEYMRLTTGDTVTVTGTIGQGYRVIATSVRGRS